MRGLDPSHGLPPARQTRAARFRTVRATSSDRLMVDGFLPTARRSSRNSSKASLQTSASFSEPTYGSSSST
jgi:hypothetical protein